MSPALLTLTTLIAALVAMAFYTLFERKFLACAQLRNGPSNVGFAGLLQPFADAVNLFLNQRLTPNRANWTGFTAAPAAGLGLALILWLLYPHTHVNSFIPFGAILFLVISSLSVYILLAAGWSSNSKYALLGTIRAIAQTISYEIAIALLLYAALLLLISYNFTSHMFSQSTCNACLIPPLFICWFVTILAETHRAPFDFAEGESELVSGFNVEYGGGNFAFLFIAEYINILVICAFTSALFSPYVLITTFALATLFIAVRAALPRIRYDQLMILTWNSYLPFALFILLIFLPVILYD